MDRNTTQKLKGLAILIMIMHHFCATTLFPDISSGALRFGETCKICVAIYAVLSGYGYYFAKEKTVKFGVKKYVGFYRFIGYCCSPCSFRQH